MSRRATALLPIVSLSACVGGIGELEFVDGGSTPQPATSPRDASAADVRRDAGGAAPRPDAGAVTARPDAGAVTARPYPGVPGVSPTVGGCPVFPPGDPWNRDITSAPVHPDSDAILDNIAAHGDNELRPDFGASADFGIPITVAPSSQSASPVRITEYPDESDAGPFPIPADARIEGGGDDHVLVVHQGACVLYELYHAQRVNGQWTAGAAARFDLRTNTARPQGWTSADQAGLPILAGLARYDEVAAGEIRHALRVTFEHTRAAWMHPATHPGGEDDGAAPAMGMRLRMRAGYDTSRLTGQARVIANALKRYGLFVADTGTNWFVSGETHPRWNDRDLAQLRAIPGSAFEVLDTAPAQTR